MDDEGDDWGDALAGFDIGDLSQGQRQALSTDLAEAGILHAFVGPQLQGPAAESEQIERMVAQTRRGGVRRRTVAPRPTAAERAQQPIAAMLPRFIRQPFGSAPAATRDLPIARRWRRFAAYLAESIAIGIVVSLVLAYSEGGAQVMAVSLGLLSSVVLVATLGATLGMMVFRMRVVSIGSPERVAVGWRVAVIRYLVAWWPEALLLLLDVFYDVEDLSWVGGVMQSWLIVCFAPILFDEARRGLHDRIAGTVVIDVGR